MYLVIRREKGTSKFEICFRGTVDKFYYKENEFGIVCDSAKGLNDVFGDQYVYSVERSTIEQAINRGYRVCPEVDEDQLRTVTI